ncbi:MAG: IS5 family transposase [Cohaesibacter sp.]|nr:IS5 family transposase [Cohaesibacter sp.]
MDPSRFVLTDRQWLTIEPLCPGGLSAPGRTGVDTRLFLEAVLWIVRTDAPWRDLPSEFGNWNSTFRRFRRWVQADVFKRIFDALSNEPDMEYAMIDATIVKVHLHGMGAKGGPQSQAIGKSKGGWTTKILALVDALGNLVRFILMPANRYDTVGVAPLIRGVEFGAILADKAFDSNWIIDDMNARGAKIVISQRPQRLQPLEIDEEMYKWRHLIENYFQKLKEFKRIAMRSDKTDASYGAMICLCAAIINAR